MNTKLTKLLRLNHLVINQFREWFFYIDHKGLLYLEETEHKNYASALKDQKFLDQFYTNLVQNKTERNEKYQYVSKCWGEYNYVNCYTKAIILTGIENEDGILVLNSNGLVKTIFDPLKMCIDKQGVLYHKISLNDLEYGVFSTDLSMHFSDLISTNSNDQVSISFNNQNYIIEPLL